MIFSTIVGIVLFGGSVMFRCDGMSSRVALAGLGILVDAAHGVALLDRNERAGALVAVVEHEAPLVVEMYGVEEHLAGGIGLSVLPLLHNDSDADLVEAGLAESQVINFVVDYGEEFVDIDEALDFFVVQFARNDFTVLLLLSINHSCGIIKFAILHVCHVNTNEFLDSCGIGIGEILFEFSRHIERIDGLLLVFMAAGRARSEEYGEAEDEEVR